MSSLTHILARPTPANADMNRMKEPISTRSINGCWGIFNINNGYDEFPDHAAEDKDESLRMRPEQRHYDVHVKKTGIDR